jgi:hypothetical protein
VTQPGAGVQWRFEVAIVFTGHMIDRPERAEPRFPPRAEARVRAAIGEALKSIRRGQPSPAVGLAGGACGGDLLFHEVCEELGIATQVFLALPAAEFVAASVAPAGSAWEQRFYSLLARRGPENVKVLSEKDGLLEGETANVWQRANLWILEQALTLAPQRTLLALWDGKTGDGPGGTEHLVQVANRLGIGVAPVIEMQKLVDGS